METKQPFEDIADILKGTDIAAVEAQHAVSKADANGDGQVDIHEFTKLWPGDAESATEMFQNLDLNGDGLISTDEVKKAIESHKLPSTDLPETGQLPAPAGGC